MRQTRARVLLIAAMSSLIAVACARGGADALDAGSADGGLSDAPARDLASLDADDAPTDAPNDARVSLDACVGPELACNLIDDDCDGTVDEQAPLGSFGCDAQTHGLSFSGTAQQRVSIPSTPTLALSDGPMTIEAWIKLGASANNYATIITSTSGATNGFSLAVCLTTACDGDNIQFRQADQTVSPDVGMVRFADGAWHHIAIVRNGSSVLFYKDSALVWNFVTASRDVNTAAGVFLGWSGLDAAASSFAGVMHSVRVWNEARSTEQIRLSFMGYAPESAPLAEWSLDEGTGVVVADSVGLRNGVLGFSASVESNDPVWVAVP